MDMTVVCTKCLCQFRSMYFSLSQIADVSASCKRLSCWSNLFLLQ